MKSDPMTDRAMLDAISRKDMAGLKRALACGADANKTLKKNAWEDSYNPLVMAASYGWRQSFAVLAKAGAKRRASGGTTALAVCAQALDADGIDELVRIYGKATGSEMAQALEQLRACEVDQADGKPQIQGLVRRTFQALLGAMPEKLTARERLRCAEQMVGSVGPGFQYAMGPRRAMPLDWVAEFARLLPDRRALIGAHTRGIGDGMQSFTLVASVAAGSSSGLPDIDERLDLVARSFSIDLGSVLAIRNSISDLAGADTAVFEAARARQINAGLQHAVTEAGKPRSAGPRL